MEKIIQDFLAATSKRNIPFATFRGIQEQNRARVIRDGHPDGDELSFDQGVMIEVEWDGQLAYAATPNLTTSGIESAIDRALDLAKASKKNQLFPFARELRGQKAMQYKSPVQKPVTLSDKEVWSALQMICEKLKSGRDEVVKTSAIVDFRNLKEWWVTTDGIRIEQEFNFVSSDAEVTAQKGQSVQKRSIGGMRGLSYQGGLEFWDVQKMLPQLDRIREQAILLAAANPCPQETMDLVLMPDQMMLQIHESIGHPLEIDRILGDERNYAGGSFVKPKDFGTLKYGSDLLTVHYDPTLTQEFATFGADHLGAKAEKTTIIEKGKLLRGLGSLESQKRSDLQGCASARGSSWNRPAIDRMSNLNIQVGTESFDSIIGGIENGVMMETNTSWSIDDFRNKFQFSCEFGQRIRNGKLAEVVKNPGYRGVTVPFWNNLAATGDGTTYGVFGTPFCGKGEPNQSIRVGHASPVCKFKNIELFGGNG